MLDPDPLKTTTIYKVSSEDGTSCKYKSLANKNSLMEIFLAYMSEKFMNYDYYKKIAHITMSSNVSMLKNEK